MDILPPSRDNARREKEVDTLLTTAQLGGGIVCDQHWTSVPLKNYKGRIIGHLLTVEDVTKTREMELQVQRSERYATLGRLAATIAHEIRNPLTSIAGSIQLFSQGENRTEEEQRLTAIVVRETESLNQWITDFLTYARPIGEQRGSLDLGREVTEALEAIKYDSRFSGVEVQSNMSENALVYADPVSVKQIVWNVILNAAEAMDNGGKLCRNRRLYPRRICSVAGNRYRTWNKDRACRANFRSFFTTKTSGTGLGLATAFRLATELGGKLDFHSLYGEGTTFYIDLPKPVRTESLKPSSAVIGLNLSDEDRQMVESEMAFRKTGEFPGADTDEPAPSITS